MRTDLTRSPADHIVLVGTGAAAMAALWRLCAAGARIRWYADRTDVGEEAVFAHALGGGRVALSFEDPLTAPLDGATAIVVAGDNRRHARLVERARASGVAIHLIGEDVLSGFSPSGLVRTRDMAAAATT